MQILAEESLWEAEIAKWILMLSNGGFLRVILVVDTILAKHDEGSSLVTSLTHVDQMPSKLRELYIQIIQELLIADKAITNKMFQWLLALGSWGSQTSST